MKAKIYQITQGRKSVNVLAFNKQEAIETADLRTMGLPNVNQIMPVKVRVDNAGYPEAFYDRDAVYSTGWIPSQYETASSVYERLGVE